VDNREIPASTLLVASLMVVLEAASDDDLVKKLHDRGINVQLRSLQRWKSGHGPRWQQAFPLLRAAGWLTDQAPANLGPPDLPPGRRMDEIVRVIRAIRDDPTAPALSEGP
jgi:hypothetical protein